jgi:ketosteroid isomerase-like protein
MKFPLPLSLFPILALPVALLSAPDDLQRPAPNPSALVLLAPAEIDHLVAAVRAADDERVAATVAADRARMDAVYSDQLHYTHSNGKFDTKQSYLEAVVSRRTVYSAYEYEKRDFQIASPEVVVMTAHAFITAGTASAPNKLDLNVMAVWRLESGKWRFLSWLSSKIPPPAAPAGK